MDHFPHGDVGPGPDRQHGSAPGPAEPGRWPELEAALAVVNRDLRATLPEQEALILLADPPRRPPSPGGIDRGQVYVALPDGRWHGNAVNACGPEEGDPPEPDDATTVLTVVADAAQETIMEILWRVWPICPEHGIGTHPRPAGTTDDSYLDDDEGGGRDAAGPPVWWCRGSRVGDCHDVAPIGELAAALPGKQRRALRRRERERGGR